MIEKFSDYFDSQFIPVLKGGDFLRKNVNISYNKESWNCLLGIKELVPEIRTNDVNGHSRWNNLENLNEVNIPHNGDILLFYNFSKLLKQPYPCHAMLIANIGELPRPKGRGFRKEA
jgi:hypothetical protein